MALVESKSIPLDTKMPEFILSDPAGESFNSHELFGRKGLLVIFTCNHCPYVTGSDEVTRKTALHFEKHGVKFVGINSNSENTYAEDSFDNMVKRMEKETFY